MILRASIGIIRSVFFCMISKLSKIYELLFRMDLGDNDIKEKCKSHWILKYVYHVFVFGFRWLESCQNYTCFDILFWET